MREDLGRKWGRKMRFLVENGAARVKSIDYIRAIVIIRPLSQEESLGLAWRITAVGLWGVRWGPTCRVPIGFQNTPYVLQFWVVVWLFMCN